MAFVKRNEQGHIVAVSRELADDFPELVAEDSDELQAFLAAVGQSSALAQSDLEFIRVLDDLLTILLEKNLLLFTELPEEAQRKLSERNRLRQLGRNSLDLLDSEHLI